MGDAGAGAGAGLGLPLTSLLVVVVVVVITEPPPGAALGVGDLGSLGPRLTPGLGLGCFLVVLVVVLPDVCLVTVLELILLVSEGAWLSCEPSLISRR